jgi:hypothetical protein
MAIVLARNPDLRADVVPKPHPPTAIFRGSGSRSRIHAIRRPKRAKPVPATTRGSGALAARIRMKPMVFVSLQAAMRLKPLI